jgi:hypothetical protein
MSPDSRTLVAALAWAVAHRARSGWVYDYDRAVDREITASASGVKLGAYDHARRLIMEGTLGSALLDAGVNNHLTLERTDKGVKGFDHASQAFYEAVVIADRVSLYDYADSRHHEYAVR